MEPDERALRDACSALWLATMSLMTAFMKTSAPEQRYMLARRIAENFGTLCEQGCFATPCRTRFAKLSARWQGKAEQLAPALGEVMAPTRAPVI